MKEKKETSQKSLNAEKRDLGRRYVKLKKENQELQEKIRHLKRSKEFLKQNEVKFRTIVENSHTGIFIVNSNYQMTYANSELSKILGYTHDEIIGTDFRVFVAEQDVDMVVERYKKRQRGSEVTPRYQFNIIKKDGEERKVEIISTATRELGGEVKTIAQILDITEKEKAKQELKESEEKFRIIAEQSLLSIVILQNDKVKYSNNRFGDGLGYSEEEIKKWGFRDFISLLHPSDRDFVVKESRKKQKGIDTTLNRYQIRLITKSGEIAWREVLSKSINYKGKPAELVTLIDITEKKKAEQNLKESEKKFRRIFKAIPDVFFLISEDGRILDYKGRVDYLFPASNEILGKKMKSLLPLEIKAKFENTLNNTLLTEKPQTLEYSLNIEEKIRHFEVRFLFYSKSEVVIFVREITKRKRAEEVIKQEVEMLKELDKTRRDLISRISHELKTPIMSISGATEILLNEYKENLSSEPLNLVRMIGNNKERLHKLIEKLLDSLKAEHQKISLEKNPNNICNIIRKSIEEMNYLQDRREIEVIEDLPECITVNVDELRIEQVLINLLSNAFKNTPPQGKVFVTTHLTEENLKITIKDTGIGLTEPEIKKIFTRFGKIERYGEGLEYLDIRGSGLGLFISQNIVKLHGGNIKAFSEGRNKGSTFMVTLPLH